MNTTQQEIFHSLKSSRHCKHISDESLQKLMVLADVRSFGPGEAIIQQGHKNDRLYIISRGEVLVQIDGEDVYGLKRRGDIFGEIDVATGNICTATVQTKGAVDVVTISLAAADEIQSDVNHELHHVFHVWLARVLSDKLAMATQKAKLYEKLHGQVVKELEAARYVQQAVCSSNLAVIPGLPLFLKSEFADFLGGDVYGIFEVSDNLRGILIGDVSGRGASAALIAMSILNSFQYFSKSDSSSKRVLANINNLAQHSMPPNRFMTAFYGIVDMVTKELIYTNAGHLPALLLRDGCVNRLPLSQGIPIGIHSTERAHFSENKFRLRKNDRLILFTDGVFECQKGKRLDLSQLEHLIEEHAELSSQELKDVIFEHGKILINMPREDDFTLMIFEVQ